MVAYEYGQDCADLLIVFCGVVGKDEYVVEIPRAKDVEVLVEDGVHERLECGRGVCEAEWHDEAFVQTPASTECRGLYGVGMHTDEVECST